MEQFFDAALWVVSIFTMSFWVPFFAYWGYCTARKKFGWFGTVNVYIQGEKQ